MALGARRQQVSGMFVRDGLLLACAGVAIGFVAALGLSRFLSSLLFGVRANDPSTYIFTTLGLMVAALLSSYLPSLRATAIDPIETLRVE
jgi:ABC-type antimicrobial peptide transport system permease subunit